MAGGIEPGVEEVERALLGYTETPRPVNGRGEGSHEDDEGLSREEEIIKKGRRGLRKAVRSMSAARIAIENFDEVDLHNEEKVDAAMGNMNAGLSDGCFGPGQLGVEYPRLWNAKRIMVESRELAALDPADRRSRSRKEAVMLDAKRASDLLADLMAWDNQDDPGEGEEEEEEEGEGEGEEKAPEPTALEKADELISQFCSVTPRRNVRVALDGSSMHEVSSPACQALSELLVGERQSAPA